MGRPPSCNDDILLWRIVNAVLTSNFETRCIICKKKASHVRDRRFQNDNLLLNIHVLNSFQEEGQIVDDELSRFQLRRRWETR